MEALVVRRDGPIAAVHPVLPISASVSVHGSVNPGHEHAFRNLVCNVGREKPRDADASRRIPKAVLFVVATGSYRIDHPSPCTSSLACRMTRASTAAGWSAWTTAYRPATATITIATKATACTRSLGLRATPRPPSDQDPHRTDDDTRAHNRPSDQDDAQGAQRILVGQGLAQGIDVAVMAGGVHDAVRDHGRTEDVAGGRRLEGPCQSSGRRVEGIDRPMVLVRGKDDPASRVRQGGLDRPVWREGPFHGAVK